MYARVNDLGSLVLRQMQNGFHRGCSRLALLYCFRLIFLFFFGTLVSACTVHLQREIEYRKEVCFDTNGVYCTHGKEYNNVIVGT